MVNKSDIINPISLSRQNSPEISVIIVNFNTAELLTKCLQSIQKQKGAAFEIFVVDNASIDDSVHRISTEFEQIHLITNQRNLGFSAANNQAIRNSKGNLLLFLNPDTVVHDGAFHAMLDYLSLNPEVGLAGARIINPDGSHQSSVEHRYPGQRHTKGELSGLPGKIAWLSGAAIIARGELIEKIKGFDERYFLYGEDIDICLNARKAGYPIGYIPNAIITHWGGQSEILTPATDVLLKKFKAEIIFYRKHYSEKAVQAICRANMVQAYWRILTLSWTLPFSLSKQHHRAKLARYRLAFDFFKKAYSS